MKYNDKLDADQQITMEEQIASYLFNDGVDLDNGQGEGPSEEFCNKMGKEILLMVLTEFRKDLVGEPSVEPDLEAYVQGGGVACPFCTNGDIEGGNVEIDAGGAYQPITCSCGSSWNDVYQLVGISEIDRGSHRRNEPYCAKCGGECQYDSDGKLLRT